MVVAVARRPTVSVVQAALPTGAPAVAPAATAAQENLFPNGVFRVLARKAVAGNAHGAVSPATASTASVAARQAAGSTTAVRDGQTGECA